MDIKRFGYLAVVILVLVFYTILRKILKLPPLGTKKQLLLFFFLTYTTNFLWDTFAVLSKHWEYKNMLGVYLGYSPVENILFSIAFPIAVITIYQIISRRSKIL